MSELVRRSIRSTVVGFALAAVMVAMVLWFNIARLTEIFLLSDQRVLTVLAIWAPIGLVFSALQFGLSGCDTTDDEDDDGPSGGFRQYELRPIPVRHDDQRRR